ncbi:TIR domain-containing protein [Occultella kanbiaonis]|uniref:TIR domain-containing protein n=1 Tax=Occultella kanbiaonis TaxID=2675754 RepID=UPI0012B8A0FD|nr:TIR domain-containing protein [Occultella kanbiaonis]
MTEHSDVKVFISWSGDMAKSVALALREWLPLLFDRVAPWASDTDIAAGQRGLAQIEAELADTSFGLVVVTAENQHAPWLNFEAGALSKTVARDAEHRVVPLLVDLASPADLTGPLAQFQAKTARQDGVRDVVRSLAAVAGVDQAVAGRRFDAYWSQLEAKIDAAKAAAPGGAAVPERRREADVLDEILLHVRSLRSDRVNPPRSDLIPTTAERHEQRFHKFVTDLAAAHGMRVFDISGPPLGDLEVTFAPTGDYSDAAGEAVKQALHEYATTNQQKISVVVIPF